MAVEEEALSSDSRHRADISCPTLPSDNLLHSTRNTETNHKKNNNESPIKNNHLKLQKTTTNYAKKSPQSPTIDQKSPKTYVHTSWEFTYAVFLKSELSLSTTAESWLFFSTLTRDYGGECVVSVCGCEGVCVVSGEGVGVGV